MLVLSRERDETIMIGDDIEVMVVDIRGEKVRLGTIARPEVPVHRKETFESLVNGLISRGRIKSASEVTNALLIEEWNLIPREEGAHVGGFLVLSRQLDEILTIGCDIEVQVVHIRGSKVRLGINAPPHVPVHRKEVYEAIKREKQVHPTGDGNAGKADSLADRKHGTGKGKN